MFVDAASGIGPANLDDDWTEQRLPDRVLADWGVENPQQATSTSEVYLRVLIPTSLLQDILHFADIGLCQSSCIRLLLL